MLTNNWMSEFILRVFRPLDYWTLRAKKLKQETNWEVDYRSKGKNPNFKYHVTLLTPRQTIKQSFDGDDMIKLIKDAVLFGEECYEASKRNHSLTPKKHK